MPTRKEMQAANVNGLEAALNIKTERGYLSTNLGRNSDRVLEFPLNPTVLREVFNARYKRFSSPGYSSQHLHFLGNDNVKIPLELYFDQLILTQRGSTKELNNSNEVNEARKFLISLIYPRRSRSIRAASPPSVTFHWPNMITMNVRVMKVEFEHRLFQIGTLLPRIMVAKLQLEEEPSERIYSSDALRMGTLRPWSGGSR